MKDINVQPKPFRVIFPTQYFKNRLITKGTYTVGSGGDFLTISEAINAVSNNPDGPITFYCRGTYEV